MPRTPKTAALPVPDDLHQRIHFIRGMHVMLDEDLAKLYGVEIRALNQAVKRNEARFPPAFFFQLTRDETEILRSQSVILRSETEEAEGLRSQTGILEKVHGKHRKYLPYVFTEQGVAMLSAVLRSETAIQISIRIMEAFVAMRRFIHANAGVFQRLDGIERRQLSHEAETDRRFEQVFDALEKPETLPRQGIFFDGQMYDAHAFASRLIRSANKSIILIDNYVDETVLTLLAKRTRGIPATVYTRTITAQLHLDARKHNTQYPTLEIHEFADAHDRFLILDGETVYHLGASLKDLGKKWFAFSRFDRGVAGMLERLL